MGAAARRRPKQLAKKLYSIRLALKLSQNGLIRRMGLLDEISQAEISMYERGVRVPPLTVLMQYARVANVYLELIVGDKFDLPSDRPVPANNRYARTKTFNR